MTKKLLLLCAVVMMCVGRIAAQEAWYVVSDNGHCVNVNEVAYMLFTDDSEKFANLISRIKELEKSDESNPEINDITKKVEEYKMSALTSGSYYI